LVVRESHYRRLAHTITGESPMLRKSMGPIVAACLVLTACRDNSDPIPTSPIAVQNESEGRGFAQRFYAIGTSISAGTCSAGNVSWCQQNSG
jgi:hypothetical protein